MKKKKITLLGGGTGNHTVLSGLRHYTEALDIRTIVTTADDGGSTGVLKDELGVLPPGDIGKCMVALSRQPEMIRKVLSYRFEEGALKGHTGVNILLSIMEKVAGREDAIGILSEWWDVSGETIPVTFDDVTLLAETLRGKVKKGENLIDKVMHDDQIRRVYYDQQPSVNPRVVEVLLDAELIVISPGDVHTSISPILIIEEIQEVFLSTGAQRMLIVPLVNKHGHTNNFSVRSYVEFYEGLLGTPCIDVVMHNIAQPAKELLDIYQKEGDLVCLTDPLPTSVHLIQRELIAREIVQKSQSDIVERSLIRHDPVKTAAAIFKFLNSQD